MDLKTISKTPPWEWPEDTGPGLLRILQGARENPADRLLAAELAGDLIVSSDELVRQLLAIVGDGSASPELRAQAAISLGPVLEYADTEGFEEISESPISEAVFHDIQKTLRELFAEMSTPAPLRRRILEAAVRAPEEWQVEATRVAYRSAEPHWRLTAVFCMRFLRGFDKEILEAITSNDEDVKTEAVHAAGAWELRPAFPQVAALLRGRTTPRPLLLAAIAAAPQINAERAHELLMDLADVDDDEIAESVEEALAMAEAGEDEDEDEEMR